MDSTTYHNMLKLNCALRKLLVHGKTKNKQQPKDGSPETSPHSMFLLTELKSTTGIGRLKSLIIPALNISMVGMQ